MTKLVGTAPNQVPTNADLGKLAYQDAISSNPYTAQSTAATGYITLVGGLIIQWGSFTAAGRTDVTTNFAITFPNACLSVAMSQTGDQDSGGSNGPYLARKTVSTTQLQVRNSAYSHTMTINYIAIGH